MINVLTGLGLLLLFFNGLGLLMMCRILDRIVDELWKRNELEAQLARHRGEIDAGPR